MVARLVLKIGDHSITQDDLGQYHVLDSHAQEVGAGPNLETMAQLGRLMTKAGELTIDGLCACQSCQDGRLIARLSDALASATREVSRLKEIVGKLGGQP